ncbi:MAG: ester cyclase [Bacteroidales bacterium]|nr:ester cyclase [Bacteroidales bacterium]
METQNKLIVKDYIEKVVNTGYIDILQKYISPDYVEVFNNKKHEIGIEGAKEHVTGVRRTYPDLKLYIDKQIAEGEWVATCYTMTGTHSGSWMGMKPTGKKMMVTGVNINRVVNGKIVEHGGAANMFEGFLNIGAIKIMGENK